MLYAQQILVEYFSIVKQTDIIAQLKNKFDNSVIHTTKLTDNLKPYKFEKIRDIQLINYTQFQLLVKRRRSIRYYQNKEVMNSEIEKAVKLAKCSPSPCNRYSVRYHCISDKKLIKQVGSIVGGARSFIDNVPKLMVISVFLQLMKVCMIDMLYILTLVYL